MSTITNQSGVVFCCPTKNIFPSLELYMGEIGTRSQNEDSGIFLRIKNPKALRQGDIVYARHRSSRSVNSRSTHTRLGNVRLMRIINGQGINGANICPWWDNFAPILDPSTLSVTPDNGNTYSWVKVNELNVLQDCVRKYGKFFWAGNHNIRSKYDTTPNYSINKGEHHNFTALDFVLVRNDSIIATSNRYLLNAYGYTIQNIAHVSITFREIEPQS